ncbi:MAG TPA: DMT family transporter [Burkholderiales bacterium]|nr:DMT family transporter [Burkholderiales bacterium]
MTTDHAHQRRMLRGIALMMSAVFMFSSMDTLAKYLLRSYPLAGLLWARYVVNLAVVVALLWPSRGLALLRTRRPALQIIRGLLLVGSTMFFYFALRHMPLAEAAAISFVGPVLTTLLSGWVLGEKATPRQWVAVIFGFAGVLIIIRPGGGLFTPAALFPLCTAALFSVYQIITRKLSGHDHPYTTLFYTALVGGAATSFTLPWGWQTPTLVQALLMIGIGLLGGYGHYLLIRAMDKASPSALAPFVYSQLVWSTLLAFLAFRDFPDGGSLTGMAVIVTAGLMAVNWKQMRRITDAADSAASH